MSWFRVRSDCSPLILVLGLGLWLATPAHAHREQGTEAAHVRQIEGAHGGGSLSSTGPLQPSAVESTPAATEPALRTERPGTAEAGLSSFVSKLAFDLGLIRERDEDAWAALARAGIAPVGGWQRGAELRPEVVYEVLAAARREASAGRLSVSADGAEAIVRAALPPSLAQPEEVPATQPLVAAPEDRTVVAGQGHVLFYEHVPTWYAGWPSGFLAAPGGVVLYHPRGFHGRHGHHKFLPHKSWRRHHAHKSWKRHHGHTPFGLSAGRSHAFAGSRHHPSLRAGSTPSWGRSPSVSRMSRGPSARQPSLGRRAGGFSRR
jgi:hypothetical protein